MICASVLPKDLGDWAGTIEFAFGASFAGKDLKDLSVVDKMRAGITTLREINKVTFIEG